jgi:hypothetical protein
MGPASHYPGTCGLTLLPQALELPPPMNSFPYYLFTSKKQKSLSIPSLTGVAVRVASSFQQLTKFWKVGMTINFLLQLFLLE